MPAPAMRSGRSRRAQMRRAQWIIGLGALAITLALWAARWTMRLDLAAADLRVRHFGIYTPEPSDRLVLIAIDDGTLETLRLWPIPREAWALVVRELDRAGARVIAFDVLFDDQGSTAWPPAFDPAPTPANLELAAAIRDHGRTVLASSFNPARRRGAVRTFASGSIPLIDFPEIHSILRAAPELEDAALIDRLIDRARSPRQAAELGLGAGPIVNDVRRKAAVARTMLTDGQRSSLPVPDDDRRWVTSDEPAPPIGVLASAAASIGSVSFGGPDPDGAVRRVPLWARAGDRLYPYLGLQAAAMFLAAESDATPLPILQRRATHIPHAAAALDIERHELLLAMGGEPVVEARDGIHTIAWPRSAFDWSAWGERGWRAQLGPANDPQRAIVVLGRLLDPFVLVHSTQSRTIASIDRSMRAVHTADLYTIPDFEAYEARAAQLADPKLDLDLWIPLVEQQAAVWREVIAGAQETFALVSEGLPAGADIATGEGLADLDPADIERLRALHRIAHEMGPVVDGVDEVLLKLHAWRDIELPALVEGKLCFIGWTATAIDADFKKTPIAARTPGVLIHMAVANEVLTGHVKHPAAWWLNVLAIVGMNLLGTWLATRLSVFGAPLGVVGLSLLWYLANGILIWDLADTDIDAGTPVVAAVLGWFGVMLHRLLVEQRARHRTEARFRSYVPEEVVEILVSNPRLDSMEPQRRELTIMFSDIAGFTTLAERLGTERTQRVLSTYLERMTEVLAAHRATIDKFLGDGIMAFWGAPVDDPDHARHAAEAVIQMQSALDEMNAAGVFGSETGPLVVRVGLAAGEVSVGDFGNPPRKSAYTVIGDAVNLAARLESACKQLGTRSLISGRVQELLAAGGGGLTVRPIGRLVVRGKVEPEWIGELIGGLRPHGSRTGEWIALSAQLASAFREGRFDDCRGCADRLEREFGEVALATVYRASILECSMEDGRPVAGFDGAIRLREK